MLYAEGKNKLFSTLYKLFDN